jgi:hypothetical protein
MKAFWVGFEKRAGVKDVAKTVLSRGASAVIAPFRGLGRAGKGITDTFEGIGGMAQNLKSTTGNVDALSSSLKSSIEGMGKNVEKATKDIGHLPKIVGAGVAGATGIYGLSKLLGMPKAYQEHGYYKRNKELAEKQLQMLEEEKNRRGYGRGCDWRW